jgi:hypothetical protein
MIEDAEISWLNARSVPGQVPDLLTAPIRSAEFTRLRLAVRWRFAGVSLFIVVFTLLFFLAQLTESMMPLDAMRKADVRVLEATLGRIKGESQLLTPGTIAAVQALRRRQEWVPLVDQIIGRQPACLELRQLACNENGTVEIIGGCSRASAYHEFISSLASAPLVNSIVSASLNVVDRMTLQGASRTAEPQYDFKITLRLRPKET